MMFFNVKNYHYAQTIQYLRPSRKMGNCMIWTSQDTLPAKNMEYFLFQRRFAFLWAVQGISVLETLSYEQILLLEELIST